MERSLPVPWCNGLMDTSNRTRPMFTVPCPCVLVHPLTSHLGQVPSGIAIMFRSLPWVSEENFTKRRVARPELCLSSFYHAPQSLFSATRLSHHSQIFTDPSRVTVVMSLSDQTSINCWVA